MGSGASKDSKKVKSETFTVSNASPYTIYTMLVKEDVFQEFRKEVNIGLKVCSNGGKVKIKNSKSFDPALLNNYNESIIVISSMHSQSFSRNKSNYLSVYATEDNGEFCTICHFHNLQEHTTGVVFSVIPEIHVHNCESGNEWIDVEKHDHRNDFQRIEEYMDAKRELKNLKSRNRISDLKYLK